MSEILPKSGKPKLDPTIARAVATRIILEDDLVTADAVAALSVIVLGVRGYFRNSLGKPNANDRGLYDDAAFIITPTDVYPFNWNTDPSRIGFNVTAGKNMAELAPGVWPFRQGPHKRIPGRFRQLTDEDADRAELEVYFRDERADGEFLVRRIDKRGGIDYERGYQAINIHPGSQVGTGSAGCQTCPTAQWADFAGTLNRELARYGQEWERAERGAGVFLYVLTEERLA